MTREHHEIWTDGRRGGIACVHVDEYGDGRFVAWSEAEKITANQMGKALKKAFPTVEFQSGVGDKDTLRMDGQNV